jgi:hypothetical protein
VTAICAACLWPARRHPYAKSWHQTSALAYGIVGAAADQGCGYRLPAKSRHGLSLMAKGERYKEPAALAA